MELDILNLAHLVTGYIVALFLRTTWKALRTENNSVDCV